MTTKHELLAPEETEELEKNAVLKDKMEELKLSLDDSSDKNRNFFMTFLLIQIYLLITVAGTSDLQLLMPESNLQLPIVNFSAPLFGFYILAPVFLIAFHFNVLFNLQSHSRKLFTWARHNGTRQDDLFLPAFMFNSLSGFKPGLAGHTLLRLIIFSVIYFFPLALLLFIQWRFADYHNLYISGWHFATIMADIFLLKIYWRHIIDSEMHGDEYESWDYLRRSSLYIDLPLRLLGSLRTLLKILPAFLPIAACFVAAYTPGVKEEAAKWLIFGGGAFFVIFILATLLNWKKLSKETFREARKRMFAAVYLLRLLRRKESGVFVPPGNELGFRKTPKKENDVPAISDPLSGFSLLICAIALLNLGTLGVIKYSDLEWHGYLMEKFANHSEKINFFIPRIEASEQRLFKLLPDKDIILKNSLRKLDWLDAYEGVTLKNRDLRLADLGKAILYKIDFRGSDLKGANLRKADLRRADLRKALLNEADLGEADLSEADLREADLGKASLDRARLRKAILSRAFLNSASLKKAKLWKATFSGADLAGANFIEADLRYANFTGADLRGANFAGADLGKATFTGADLEKAIFTGADLGIAILIGADLESATLAGANLTYAIFTGADLRRANFSGANLWKAKLIGADLEKAVLSGAYAEQAVLYGAGTSEANFSGGFGTINYWPSSGEAWKKAHGVLESKLYSLRTILSEKLKAALSSEQMEGVKRRMRSVEEKFDRAKKRLEMAEKRAVDVSERSKSRKKDDVKAFVKFRREYSCKIGEYPEYAVLAMLDLYRRKVFDMAFGRELLEHMEKNCPKVLEKMKKIKGDETTRFFR